MKEHELFRAMSADALEACMDVPCEFPVVSHDRASGAEAASVECSVIGSARGEEDQDPLMEACIQLMSQMQATRPELLRGIRVFRVVQSAPRHYMRGRLNHLYAFSEATHELDEFWSHSWQAGMWSKYASILFLNNGLAAFVVGTLCAILPFCLRASGLLSFGNLCVPCGTLGYYLTLLLWPQRKVVFLDAACIHQADEALKAEGLLNMGAILKRSKSLCHSWVRFYMFKGT